MLPLSLKERDLIVFHKKNGEKNTDICKWLQINVRTVTKIWHRYKHTGSCCAYPQNSGRKPLVSQEQMDKVVEKIKEKPDITLKRLIDVFSLGISQAALCKRLKHLGYTLKKRRYIRQSKNEKTFCASMPNW
ncbi:MAG: IS630 transposase-related protein [Chitinispirillales bacterium]|jgi:transposase|nr:IS630 transposase-related protein [Chitinispirillales bacterium]